MGSITKVIVRLPIVERIGTCGRGTAFLGTYFPAYQTRHIHAI